MKARSSEPSFLREFEESCGLLLRIDNGEGFCTAVFSWGKIALPMELESRLESLIDKKIGILRLDGYHVRCRDEPKGVMKVEG